MPDPTPDELERIAADRAAMFRPDWFSRLFGAKLALGETFWGGHVGIQLVLMPLWLVLIVILPQIAPGLAAGGILVFFSFSVLVSALVSRAVLSIALRGEGGAWRWGAAGLSALITFTSLVLLLRWIGQSV
ncbi:hypothetical protein ACN2XU_03115 [Primorskyibacter sp. 2E107]|uniref:hypothetical protein n=1 Tax=Primorskyibacter sp. 2E107 TaxID=3403458 RepID=UPI003AF84954